MKLSLVKHKIWHLTFGCFDYLTVVVSSGSVNSAGFSRIKSVGLNWGPRYGHVPVCMCVTCMGKCMSHVTCHMSHVHVRNMHGQPLRYIKAQNPAMHTTCVTGTWCHRTYEICHLLPWRWYEETVQANNISGPSGWGKKCIFPLQISKYTSANASIQD